MFEHLVRIGCLGHVGRFSSVEPRRFGRGTRVVCRTSRGLEVGEILTAVEGSPTDVAPGEAESRFGSAGSSAITATPSRHDVSAGRTGDGQILRRVTVEDELLLARLARHSRSAYDACTQLLRERGLNDLLLEVEHLFDGQSLYFYFLGTPSTEVEQLTHELAMAYDARAQIGKFADALTTGCGPDCGTERASGCGSHGCSSCAATSGCPLATRPGATV